MSDQTLTDEQVREYHYDSRVSNAAYKIENGLVDLLGVVANGEIEAREIVDECWDLARERQS